MDLPISETWQAIPEDWTAEQRQAHVASEQAKLVEQLKKNKKKPKTAEEDAKDKEELLSKVCQSMTTQFTESEIDKCEAEIELIKTEWLMEHHLKMDSDAFEKLNRKMSILDMDIGDLDVVLRTDLDVPLSPYVPLPPLEEEFKELLEAQEAEAAQASQKKKQKKSKKQMEEEAELMAKYEQGKLARDEPWKMRQVIDHRLLRRAESSIKLLQERQAKRIIMLSSLGDKCGRVKNENSVRALIPHLQSTDIPVHYLDAKMIDNAANIVEDLKEGVLYVAENLNFRPDEHSYVEPWVEPEDPNKPKEEKKEEAPPVDLKKMSAAEKKKYEEE